MDIKGVLTKNLGIKRLTGESLEKAVTEYFNPLPDKEKRRVTGEIARNIIKGLCAEGRAEEREGSANPGSLREAKVLGVNHAGPLDVTIEWKTLPDGTLDPAGCHVHSGGDQVNVAKVFSDFGETIALVALTGKEDGELTREWERNFLNKNIIAELIRDDSEDQQVALYNIIDGAPLTGMFGWADELSEEKVDRINRAALTMLDKMFKAGRETVWMVISAGGPIRYNKDHACYASLAKKVKEKYRDRVGFLMDFKFLSGPEEAMSVIDMKRDRPLDIIKPNLEEFIQILTASGLAEKYTMDKNTITDETVKKYAVKLREKYNLLGVLVSMDKNGLLLVTPEKTIREKGIDLVPVCHTAAGDSLKAGFLYSLSNGGSLEEAVHAGNMFGSATTCMPGTRTVTPEKLAEIEALARAQGVEPVTAHRDVS